MITFFSIFQAILSILKVEWLCNQFPIRRPDTWRHPTRHWLLPTYWRSFGTKPLYLFEIFASKCIGVTTVTFQGRVTSSVTWPFDSQVAISYRCSIVTKSLSPAVSEILASKCIVVTTLTIQGQVTWPFIGRVTIGLAMVHFLLVLLWTQVSISNAFRDIPPQTSWARWRNAISSYDVICTP